jgi:hypothetical protein
LIFDFGPHRCLRPACPLHRHLRRRLPSGSGKLPGCAFLPRHDPRLTRRLYLHLGNQPLKQSQCHRLPAAFQPEQTFWNPFVYSISFCGRKITTGVAAVQFRPPWAIGLVPVIWLNCCYSLCELLAKVTLESSRWVFDDPENRMNSPGPVPVDVEEIRPAGKFGANPSRASAFE